MEELERATKKNREEILETIDQLQKEYDSRETGIQIYEDQGVWKMEVKTALLPSVKNAMPKEFPKSLIETLAVITWKQPIKQSLVVEIRGNKAYKHINLLIRKDFVEAKKLGRTLLLKTTQKFSDYFGEEERTVKEMMEQYTKTYKKTKRFRE